MSSQSQYRWINENRILGKKVICLEHDSSTGADLFLVNSGYLAGSTQVSHPPRYYVWVCDECVMSSSNYEQAYREWKKKSAA